jgi:heme-degrading monooxygenase HmoA
LINLVGTRATRGEHEQLVRWYADHVHQLMAFEGLLGAVLYRRSGEGAGPDYLCLYDFFDRAAFEAYEHSDVHKNAAQDRATGWGRDGLEITVRTQYERLYRREGCQDSHHVRYVQAWQTADNHLSPATERALAALARIDDDLTLLRSAVRPSPLADYLTLTTLSYLQAEPPAPPLRWQATYQVLMRWTR